MSVLRFQYTQACARLDRRLDGLTEEEFFWEPAPGAWTLHRRADDRGVTTDGSGDWVLDYVLPEPHPAPLTTIAWRVAHIASVNVLYWDYAFGPATASFDLEFPGSAKRRARLADVQSAPNRRGHRGRCRRGRGTPDELGREVADLAHRLDPGGRADSPRRRNQPAPGPVSAPLLSGFDRGLLTGAADTLGTPGYVGRTTPLYERLRPAQVAVRVPAEIPRCRARESEECRRDAGAIDSAGAGPRSVTDP
jgi:hypothetical protein